MFEIAIEDGREHHRALTELIRSKEAQALSLLSFFGGMAVATISGAAACLGAEPVLPPPVCAPLFSATIAAIVGGVYCLRVIASSKVGCPGRGGTFWLWALEDEPDQGEAIATYLRQLQESIKHDADLNKMLAEDMAKARSCVLAMPLASFVGGCAYYLMMIGLSLLS